MAGDSNCISAKCTCFVIMCMVIMHYKRLNTGVYICSHMHVHMCVHARVHPHAHTHTHTHTHTHINFKMEVELMEHVDGCILMNILFF